VPLVRWCRHTWFRPRVERIGVAGRTLSDATDLEPAAVVAGYKNLANIERGFRIIKSNDLDLRPIHRLDDRVKAHVLICRLAYYLSWHLQQGLGTNDFHRTSTSHPATTP
jgi:transposase